MKRMSPVLVVAVGLMLCLGLVSCGQKEEDPTTGDSEKEQAAQAASDSWLQLVDSAEYGKSWDEAAGLFRGAITKDKWEDSLKSVRQPLGVAISRAVKSRKYSSSLPGAPKGEYVVIQYQTSFEKKKRAVETVTPMKDRDGTWRVSGYFIK